MIRVLILHFDPRHQVARSASAWARELVPAKDVQVQTGLSSRGPSILFADGSYIRTFTVSELVALDELRGTEWDLIDTDNLPALSPEAHQFLRTLLKR